jgi:hypothetical protein
MRTAIRRALQCAVWTALAFTAGTAAAQTPDRIARATDAVIPASPALALLGVDPSLVTRPGFAEQYKLDLIVRDDRLAPDLALALRPVWTFGYANVTATSYRNTSPVLRALSTVTLSIGTTQVDDMRRMAWSVSFSPVRPDPLLDQGYIQNLSRILAVSDRQQTIAERMATEEIRARREIEALGRDTALSEVERLGRAADVLARLEGQRDAFRAEANAIESELSDSVMAAVQEWRQRNWNETAIDIGFGRLYEYGSDALEDLALAGAGFGGWMSAASGFGTDRWLLSAMANVIDVEDQTRTALGGNVRYGGARFDAFVEYVFREIGGDDRHEVAYGGGYRLDESRSIEFGLRTSYDTDFDLRGLIPVVKLNWLVGKTRIEDLILGRSQ